MNRLCHPLAGLSSVMLDPGRAMLHNPPITLPECGMLEYKVVECSTVTDEDLEEIINHWVSEGWVFDGIQFAMRESSKRPAMAFVLFTRTQQPDSDQGA